MMDAPRWQQISRVFHEALERDPGARAAFLRDACQGDEELRREVDSLLAQRSDAGMLGETPDPRALGNLADHGLQDGRRIGVYVITGRIGAGGMGDVYRAHDTTLGRDVAIKVLPEFFEMHPDRLARFQREARVLAALNHPNIAAIYGVEQNDGIHALVLELVEGPTLADRIAGGPLPLKEALTLGRDIAAALEAAHDKGIVHRDLKPANIKLTHDGRVKVLDFGLAKAFGAEDTPLDASRTPTITATSAHGNIVGTPAYMSPEQARGQTVDRRTDVWAFGCVLYEMLAGGAAFDGGTVSDVIASILQAEPDWTALPQTVPSKIDRLLRRCLEKDVRQRFRDIGDVRLELEETLAAPAADAGAITRTHHGSRRLTWILAAAGLVAVMGLVSIWMWPRDRSETAAPISRTTVTLPTNAALALSSGSAPLTLSADGQRLAFVARADGVTRLYVRGFDSFDARALDGTDNARYPFFSPDGQSIAFFADGKLKRVSIAGGSTANICDVSRVGLGGTWGLDGTIVFDAGSSGLMTVSENGGQPKPLVSNDAAADARDYAWPQFLPDGQHLLVTVGPTLVAQGFSTLAMLSLSDHKWSELGPGSQAQYLSSGYLIYHAAHVREGELDAVPFDLKTNSIRGKPAPVLEGVFRVADGGAALYAVAQNGTLVFAPGGYARTLLSVDRQGRRTPLIQDHLGFRFPRISPDGRKVAVTIDPRPSQVWVYDIDRGSRVPLATEAHNLNPAWTPDGQRVVYSSRGDLYWRSADASSPAQPLVLRPHAQYPNSFTADGQSLLYQDQDPENGYDIWITPIGGTPKPLIATRSAELAARLSPDQHWLAYDSNESGRFEVYVRPFPNVNDRKWLISTKGGHSPVWSHDGRELFYMVGPSVMAAQIHVRGKDFEPGKPEMLFDGPFDTTQNMNFDAFPDGKHFLMVEADPDANPTRFQVVFNWAADLKKRLR